MLVVIIRLLRWTIYQVNVGGREGGSLEHYILQREFRAAQTIGQWTENHKIELQSPKVNGTMILAATFTPRDVNFHPWEWLTVLLLKHPPLIQASILFPRYYMSLSPPNLIRTSNDLSYFRKAPCGKEGWYRHWVPHQAAALHSSPTFSQSPY